MKCACGNEWCTADVSCTGVRLPITKIRKPVVTVSADPGLKWLRLLVATPAAHASLAASKERLLKGRVVKIARGHFPPATSNKGGTTSFKGASQKHHPFD